MADENYVVSYGVNIDEAGADRLQKILSENDTLASSLAGSLASAATAIEEFRKKFSGTLSAPGGSDLGGLTNGGIDGGINLFLNTTEAEKDLDAFIRSASQPIMLTANASGITSAAYSALENVRSMFAETFIINVKPNNNVDAYDDDDTKGKRNGALRMSSGGRFTRPTSVEVAEDGDTEYIIPVRKESKALPLIKQMLSDLSPEARRSVLGGTLPSVSAVESSSGISQVSNNNTNVSAPVTINVNASGANAERIGESVYNIAERYLLRTMKGVFA